QPTVDVAVDRILDPGHAAVTEQELGDPGVHAPPPEAGDPVAAVAQPRRVAPVPGLLEDGDLPVHWDRRERVVAVRVGPGEPVARLVQRLADGERVAGAVDDVADAPGTPLAADDPGAGRAVAERVGADSRQASERPGRRVVRGARRVVARVGE